MHPNFESHIHSIDKDMKFPIVLPILRRVEATDCSSFDPVVFLHKCMYK